MVIRAVPSLINQLDRQKDDEEGKIAQEERPLILSRVPVELTDCSGLNRDLNSADGLGSGEGAGVDNLDLTTVELGGLGLGEGEDERVLDGAGGADRGVLVGSGDRSREEVELLSGDMRECGGRKLEVLGEDLDWGVGEPVGENESRILAEITDVHDLGSDQMHCKLALSKDLRARTRSHQDPGR